ncbi:MAG TPA: alpha/beta fold hydrolase [Burkholderiales bacterium]
MNAPARPELELRAPADELDPPALLALEADRLARAYAARLTLGISPAALALAFGDWALHLAGSPGKLVELNRKAARKWLRFAAWLGRAAQAKPCAACIEPLEHDTRFRDPAWQQWPYNAIYQGFLFWQQWWHNATTGVHGVSAHHAQVVNFTMRQLVDLWSPSNFPWTNPEVLRAAREEAGMNFANGAANLVDDVRREALGEPPAGAEAFTPGVQVALSPGSVVMRNRLIELIRYAPATAAVHPEPVLIVPAWIMKYYILDLTPANSLVKYLVEHGHTVYMISWKNPGPEERDLSMDDYLELGVVQALEAIGVKTHLAGYCLGGTLAAIAAALMARERDERLASLTLIAAQVDFEEAGELTLFIDDSQVSLLEDMMRAQGYLDTRQMAGAFQLLRSNDMIWSRRVREYLLGRRAPMSDLAAWNSDATRMPYRMHSQYLRRLFLGNDLSGGRFEARGKRIALADVRIPLCAVGTLRDHVAPWRSVYKAGLYCDADFTFMLTSGGHNAGIVNPPGRAGSTCQVGTRREGEPYVDPDAWAAQTAPQPGSWWPQWQRWLAERSSAPAAPPAAAPALARAPGEYVLQR